MLVRSQLHPICLLCGNSEETIEHFLLTCNCLDGIRAPLVKEIINTSSALFAKNKLDGNFNLIQVLVNPYAYSNNGEFTNIISEHLEPLCRFPEADLEGGVPPPPLKFAKHICYTTLIKQFNKLGCVR
jgi:hypothetical protein